MERSLGEYIRSRNIGRDGTTNGGSQDRQGYAQQQEEQQNEQGRNVVQRNMISTKRNFQRNGQRNFQRNDQRNFQYKNKNKNHFKRKNMQNNSFDLRSKFKRQQQHNRDNRRGSNPHYSRSYNSVSDPSLIACDGTNQLGIWNLNLANELQHQNSRTNLHALQYAGVLNSCYTTAAAAAMHRQQQLLPILHQHMPAANAIVPCSMIQHQPIHSMNSIVPVGMFQNYNNHSCEHSLGSQQACITSAGCCGGVNTSFDRTTNIMSAISKLLSNNDPPMHLTVQVKSPRIAEDVEEMPNSV